MIGFSVIGFIIAACFGAGVLLATRIAKTGMQIVFLGLLFGIVFLVALSGLAVAGCIAAFSAAAAH